MRGRHILKIKIDTNAPEGGERGRISELRERRDRKLAARYYYYIKIHRLSYDAAIESLEFELDISARRIIDVLTASKHHITDYTKSATTLKSLREEYPFLVWKEPAQMSLF